MLLGIVGDVHSNLEALEAVLERMRGLNVDRYACVGDIVGYGANPRECLARVRGLTTDVVAGNHDWGVAGRVSLDYFNGAARAAIDWTATILGPNEKQFLAELPAVRETPAAALVHGSFLRPESFHYVLRTNEAAASLQLQPADLGFFGHTHLPGTFLADAEVTFSDEPVLKLTPGQRAFINGGSVGQPRDGNPQASFAVLDTESPTIYMHRVAYDIDSAAKKILDAGLPPFLAQRLFLGY